MKMFMVRLRNSISERVLIVMAEDEQTARRDAVNNLGIGFWLDSDIKSVLALTSNVIRFS